jgi:catalase
MIERTVAIGDRLVDALGLVLAQHPGHRAAHAKGILCGGTFTASPAASAITRAAHMAGAPVDVHVRFSIGGANPHARDGSKDGRGMAIKFYLPDGTTTDIVALTLSLFMVRSVDDFIAFTEARAPDPATGKPDMDKLGAYLGAHPEAGPSLQQALASRPPASYAQLAFHSIHAFRFENAAGETRCGRYHVIPEAGEAYLEDDEATGRPADYLEQELADRFAHAPAGFRLELELAQADDPVDDPTAPWPEDRERITLGRIAIDRLATGEREQSGDVLVFDPTRITEGIQLTEDPIVRARSDAYRSSVMRRTRTPRMEAS